MKISKKKLSASATFIAFMGIVSLFSDMTHEGASAISGAFLSLLGANGTVIGFVSGLGTFVGYGLRLLTGYIADKRKNYWLMTVVGYAVDLLLIPFLALVPENGWIYACTLLVVGKIGNAVKKPAKDTMVSFAASEGGEGKGFAMLEFVDQIGAFLGPTVLFFVMLLTSDLSLLNQYRICFATLALPAVCCVLLLFLAKRKFPHPEQYEKEKKESSTKGLKNTYILYLIGVCFFALGFIDFPLITAYEAEKTLVESEYLPLLYSGAMLADAFSALLFGMLYDKKGFLTLVISSLLSVPFSVLIFFTEGLGALIFGILLWGIGMGAQESIMKSAIATLTSKENRSTGYGIFQLCFGIFWFLGSTLTGWLYDIDKKAMVIVSCVCLFVGCLLFGVVTFIGKNNRKKGEKSIC